MPQVKELYERVPQIDETVCVAATEILSLRVLRLVLAARYDLLVDLANVPASAAMSLLSRASFSVAGSGRYRILGKTFSGFPLAYSRVCPRPGAMYLGDYYLQIVGMLGTEAPRPSHWQPDLGPVDEPPLESAATTKPRRPAVGFAIGASRPENLWSVESWAALATELTHECHAAVLLFGGASDIPAAESILARCGDNVATHVGSLSLLNSLRAISNLDVLVSNDTGLMHFAIACHIPTVALIGPSDHRNYLPAGRPDVRIIAAKPFCYPCYKLLNLADWTIFPECRTQIPLCKRLIDVGDVVAAVKESLSDINR